MAEKSSEEHVAELGVELLKQSSRGINTKRLRAIAVHLLHIANTEEGLPSSFLYRKVEP